MALGAIVFMSNRRMTCAPKLAAAPAAVHPSGSNTSWVAKAEFRDGQPDRSRFTNQFVSEVSVEPWGNSAAAEK